MTRTERARVFDILHEGRWLRATENKTWALGRSLGSMTLWELFLKLPSGIAIENLGGDSAVEARLRAFLEEGAIHLDVTLDTLNTSDA